MRTSVILITGANGEIGHGLITALHKKHQENIIALDLQPMDDSIRGYIREGLVGNILDKNLLEQINAEYEVSEIYHLAALLSTRAEFSPQMAHEVNVGGTINFLKLAIDQSGSRGKAVKFFFPSSIAVYGIGSLELKNKAGAVTEDAYLDPTTMYGCNKLYCEKLGTYYARFYRRLTAEYKPGLVDFRGIRFPGLISAHTVPSGGTSDYAPEMLHAAIKGEPYDCFVRPDARIPFMTMHDAVRSTLDLMSAPRENLNKLVYNVTAFSPTADELKTKITSLLPGSELDYKVTEKRQAIVDSWPADIDDSCARRDWGWQQDHDFDTAFEEYLFPRIKKHYGVD